MPSPRPPDNTNAFSRLRNKTLDKVIGVERLTRPQSSLSLLAFRSPRAIQRERAPLARWATFAKYKHTNRNRRFSLNTVLLRRLCNFFLTSFKISFSGG